METLLVAASLVIIGGVVALGGYSLFKILLPVMGFLFGYGIGFSGVQVVFGAGAVVTAIAVLTGLALGLVIAVLSYFYFFLAVTVFGAGVVASVLMLLGQSVGLREGGFILFLLGLAGVIIGALIVARYGLQDKLVVYVSSFFGVGLIFIGLFVSAGGLTMAELNQVGILTSITTVVGSSFIWLVAWIGGSLIAALVQNAIIDSQAVPSTYAIESK